jgi:threonine/homoserine/homoserine lactone efflux protein
MVVPLENEVDKSTVSRVSMPPISTVAVFLLASLVLLLIPGPAVVYVTTRSMAQGRRAGLASAAGIQLGTLAQIIAATLGLSAVLLASATAFSVVKYLGAVYLVYLGLREWLARSGDDDIDGARPKKLSALFAQGVAVQLLNPKTALFFFAFLPQFVDPARGPGAGQILVLGLLFVALACCTDGCYALLTGTLGRALRRNARFRTARRYVTGAVYVGLGLTAAVAGGTRK